PTKWSARMLLVFFIAPTATGHYSLSLHDALPIWSASVAVTAAPGRQRRKADEHSYEGHRDRYRTCHPERRDRGNAASEADHRARSEEHTSELQSRENLVCRLLLEKKKCTNRCTHA